MRTDFERLAQLNDQIERSKRVRNLAWFDFEQHRDECKFCDGNSFNTILSGATGCVEGVKYAIKVDLAHDSLRRA